MKNKNIMIVVAVVLIIVAGSRRIFWRHDVPEKSEHHHNGDSSWKGKLCRHDLDGQDGQNAAAFDRSEDKS